MKMIVPFPYGKVFAVQGHPKGYTGETASIFPCHEDYKDNSNFKTHGAHEKA